MKFGKSVNFFQDGGQMAPQGGAPAGPQGGEDPMVMLIQGAQQALQAQDCNMAMQVCQMLVEMAGGAANAPQESAPAPAQDQPVYKMGGKLSRRIPKD